MSLGDNDQNVDLTNKIPDHKRDVPKHYPYDSAEYNVYHGTTKNQKFIKELKYNTKIKYHTSIINMIDGKITGDKITLIYERPQISLSSLISQHHYDLIEIEDRHTNIIHEYQHIHPHKNNLNSARNILANSQEITTFIPERILKSQYIKYIKSIITAVAYLHSNNIVHCQVGIDNIAICGNLKNAKLCNFEFACSPEELNSPNFLPKKLGCGLAAPDLTIMAPELFQLGQPRDYTIDCWSIGILVCELLIGYNPIINNIKDIKSLSQTNSTIQFNIWEEDFIENFLLRDDFIDEIITDSKRYAYSSGLNPQIKGFLGWSLCRRDIRKSAKKLLGHHMLGNKLPRI